MDSRLSTSIDVMNQRIAGTLYQVREDKCRAIRQQLADERRHLAEILSNLDDNAFNAEKERERTNYILDMILSKSSQAYSEVFDRQMSVDEFINQMQNVRG